VSAVAGRASGPEPAGATALRPAPFALAYARYAAAVAAELTRTAADRDDAPNAQDALDAAWDRASRQLPPVAAIGRVHLTHRRGFFLLHAVARQATWPDESDQVADDKLALSTEPPRFTLASHP
jgi:hypothetical protein